MRACKRSIVGHSDVKGLSNSRSIKRLGGERAKGKSEPRRIGIRMLTVGSVNTCSRAAHR